MTESEFKQWFSGFVEGIEGKVPTAKQWKKIQDRVGEITGTPVVQKFFYDRYWNPYYSGPYWGSSWSSDAASLTTLKGEARSLEGAQNAMSFALSGAAAMIEEAKEASKSYKGGEDFVSYEPVFDANDAMYSLGRADALAT